MDKFRENFREEAFELLNSLEASLLELENNPENEAEISAVFRSMHTIKGSAAMFGFDHISEFAHEIENMLEFLRDGRISVTDELINLTLKARDHVRELLEIEGEVPKDVRDASERIQVEFKEYVVGLLEPQGDRSDAPSAPAGDLSAIGDEAEGREAAVPTGSAGAQTAAYARIDEDTADSSELDHYVTYRVRFKPNADIFRNGTRPLMLLRELAEFGDCTSVPYTDHIPGLSELDPESCYTQWDVVLTTKKPASAIRDVFIFVEDDCELSINVIDDLSEVEENHKRLGEILADRGVVPREAIDRAAGRQKRLGEVLVEDGVDQREIESALQEQQHVDRSRQKLRRETSSSSIRVSSEKLDQLVDLVGEIVTLQARLTQTSTRMEDAGLNSIAENFERLTDELRDSTMSIRMLPIGTTFSKFRRLVRDLSQELGKEVEMEANGGETELDKTVIERLNDPLVHIIRNAIDHGVETPAEREAAGKPRAGTVSLTAAHAGAEVLISIFDDGAGLDREGILAKARSKGLLRGDEEPSDEDVWQLLFAPGFSTNENVTTVSGRGVGMDVVKKEIDNLGGTVRIETSPGHGTTFKLSIPLTLAIIDGLLVRIGAQHYVFPLSAVGECIELTKEMREEQGGGRIINNRGEILPYVRLREVFGIDGSYDGIEQVVVANSQQGTVGFVVDNVIGDFQTVIKNLGKLYRDLEGISGATILGDGTVALILDLQRLTALATTGGVEVSHA
ncbi:MAG: chemotaxis protein CheA [Spirochaetes bacterium]|jgi:two-component system chemotaxis sensor kinase CheA|nr:chemotaxis protein CheA [Spirochaetota bacterium]